MTETLAPTGATAGADGAGETLGRRELNKARTREAITEALRCLLHDTPAPRITVDQLADEAGVSRRTFFNYYAGIPAVISEVIGTHTAGLAEALGDFDLTRSVFGQLRDLIRTTGIPAGFMEWMALLNLHACPDDPAHAAIERTVWAEKAAWLETVLLERLPEDIDPLFVATLAPAVMNCFAAADRSWSARRDPRDPVDDAAMADFHDELDRALAYAESGWASPAGAAPDSNVARD